MSSESIQRSARPANDWIGDGMGDVSEPSWSQELNLRYSPARTAGYNPGPQGWTLHLPDYERSLHATPPTDQEGSPKKHKTGMDLARKFAKNTSLGGMAYMNNANRCWSTAFWIVVFVTGMGLCMAHLYLIIQNYLDYPYSTIDKIKHDFLPFPSVTICNRNPIRVSGMPQLSQAMQKFLHNMAPSPQGREQGHQGGDNGNINPELDDGTNAGPNPLITSTEQNLPPNAGENPGPQNGSPPTGRKKGRFAISSSQADSFSNYQEFLELFGNVSMEGRQQAGHQKDVLVIDCSFNGYKCYNDNFTQLLSPEYGNCFTFNSAEISDNSYLSRQHGRTYGLRLVLFAEIQEYPSGVTEAKGFSVSIHPFNTMPFPEVTGISVSPGFETSIGINYVNVTKLGTPYNDCKDTNSFLGQFGVYYTHQTCQVTCYYKQIVVQCGCYYAPFEMYYAAAVLETFSGCYTSEDYECIAGVEDSFKNGTYACTCHPGCTETTYRFQYSMVSWPERSLVPQYYRRACRLSQKVCQAASTSDEDRLTVITENFGVLNVYFDELTYHDLYEEGTYDEYSLASDVGGTLGLWLGVSMLTGIEVIQFFMELLHFSCRKRK